jgi:signal transduction histidine kinase
VTLRPKLALVAIGIATASCLIVALVARRTTSHELTVQLAEGSTNQADTTAAGVMSWLGAHPDLGGVEPALAAAAAAADRELLLLDAAGRCLASAPATLCQDQIAITADHRLTIRGAGPSPTQRELVGTPQFRFRRGTDAARELTLFVLPSAHAEVEPRRLVGILTNGLWLGGLVASAFAVGLSILVAQALVRPVGALTAVARRMEAGDRTARVAPVGRDEIGRLGVAFNAMADSLARQDQVRQELFHDVAHELRTPLASLRCQLEALQDGLAVPDAPHLDALHAEVVRLGGLVDDLRDLTLADAGRLDLRPETHDLMADVADAVRLATPSAASRGVRLLVHGPTSVALTADPKRVAQILANLLSNAVRHAAQGGCVEVAVADQSETVTIGVEDDGPGIAPEHLTRIFERFFRADAARAREQGGVGLGLAIVKRLAELHGGSVLAENVPGRGARVTVSLPRTWTGVGPAPDAPRPEVGARRG